VLRNSILTGLYCASVLVVTSASAQSRLPVIVANDNRTPAGTLTDGILNLNLELRPARWYPEAADGVFEDGYAFAEQGRAPQSPGPLLRVPQGTRIQATIHNLLPAAAKLYGLHAHPSASDEFVEVAAGGNRQVQFDAGEPGTYLYWATTSNAHLDRSEERDREEALLAGAFIVDPTGKRDDDRIFVLVEWAKIDSPSNEPTVVLAVNGKSWPETERLSYTAGQLVHWRVINATSIAHAMHLHGFFFTVDGVGDPIRFVHYPEPQRRSAVTEGVFPGHSFNMTWTPDRPGHWLFHCHMTLHMAPQVPLHPPNPQPSAATSIHDHSAGMGGLVMGIDVLPVKSDAAPRRANAESPRKLKLLVSENPAKVPLYKLELIDPADIKPPEPSKQPALLGPPILLNRGEPVEIEVLNHSTTATAIHWHGIELQSYYDGVPGYSGYGSEVTPSIEPGSSFGVHFTPPRAGTFIYHTHLHDEKPIRNGFYGPLIVQEPGQKFDPDTDRIFLFSVGVYPPLGYMLLINGQPGPDPMFLRKGQPYRFRLINITDMGADMRVRLSSRDRTLSWKVVARDGASLPAAQVVTSPAEMVLTVGSTCDVEVVLENTGLHQLHISSEDLMTTTMYPLISLPK
jgi:FtsP/CotA-like multicopper oxidase with cupredoxin domain